MCEGLRTLERSKVLIRISQAFSGSFCLLCESIAFTLFQSSHQCLPKICGKSQHCPTPIVAGGEARMPSCTAAASAVASHPPCSALLADGSAAAVAAIHVSSYTAPHGGLGVAIAEAERARPAWECPKMPAAQRRSESTEPDA
eukprot:COSAG01_NODE_1101_length_11689_cov_159.757722_4_plen_143_part_00